MMRVMSTIAPVTFSLPLYRATRTAPGSCFGGHVVRTERGPCPAGFYSKKILAEALQEQLLQHRVLKVQIWKFR